MRIIAGEFRGRTLLAPKGDGTRPTTDRVRESVMSTVFSARGGFEDAMVLDAFAGSGRWGSSALARGCARRVLRARPGSGEGAAEERGEDGPRAAPRYRYARRTCSNARRSSRARRSTSSSWTLPTPMPPPTCWAWLRAWLSAAWRRPTRWWCTSTRLPATTKPLPQPPNAGSNLHRARKYGDTTVDVRVPALAQTDPSKRKRELHQP